MSDYTHNNPHILIISERDIVHVDLVIDFLRKKKVRCFRFNVEDFPQKVSLNLDPVTGDGELVYPGLRKLILNDITGCWYYHSPAPKISSMIKSKANREFALGEARATINGLWRLLDDRFWINHPKYLFAGPLYKLKQIQIAHRIGFDVPKSLVTNDFLEAKRFFRTCGKVILKMVGPPPEVRGMPHVFTTLVNAANLEGAEHKIRLAPVLFQEYVEKKLELRITIVGQKIFPTAIYTADDPHAKEDWKRGKLLKMRHEIYKLTDAIQTKCLNLMQRLELNYGAIDLIVTPDNRYVFLEVNPSGAWGWIEDRLGFPISEAIANLLIREGR